LSRSLAAIAPRDASRGRSHAGFRSIGSDTHSRVHLLSLSLSLSLFFPITLSRRERSQHSDRSTHPLDDHRARYRTALYSTNIYTHNRWTHTNTYDEHSRTPTRARASPPDASSCEGRSVPQDRRSQDRARAGRSSSRESRDRSAPSRSCHDDDDDEARARARIGATIVPDRSRARPSRTRIVADDREDLPPMQIRQSRCSGTPLIAE